MKWTPLTWAALASLLVAFVVGKIGQRQRANGRLDAAFPELVLQPSESSNVLHATHRDEPSSRSYVSVADAPGWGGRLTLAMQLDSAGNLQHAEILEAHETGAFLRRVLDAGLLRRFQGLSVSDVDAEHIAVDGVSGATVTSNAIKRAVARSLEQAGRSIFEREYAEPSWAIRIGGAEAALIVLYSFVITAVVLKKTKWRSIGYVGGFLIIGVLSTTPLSLASLTAIAMGHLPSLRDQLFWWLLAGGALCSPLILRKNIYCAWMCPFAAIEEALAASGGIKFSLSPRARKFARRGTFALLWLSLMLAFLQHDASAATYEPFFIFSFIGTDFQWYLATLALLGSFFVPRFWCRFFCPVGEILSAIVKLRGQLHRSSQASPTRLPILGRHPR
ncbi:MAG: FMN-binding protein [Myxococcota bacterium]